MNVSDKIERKKSLDFRVDAQIGTLVIEGAPGNELDFDFFAALDTVLNEDIQNSGLVGLIICGRGRHFSSGSNVKNLLSHFMEIHNQKGNTSSQSWCEVHSQVFQLVTSLPFPVVAAVRGCCLGSGFELALACHYRIAANNSVFALPESQLGIIPGCAGTLTLTELVGFRHSMRLILTGHLMNTQEALDLGIVDSVVPRKELMSTAKRLISCINDQNRKVT